MLADRPDLVDQWQGYSWDKRWSPSPYLEGLEVGHYDAGKRRIRTHGFRARMATKWGRATLSRRRKKGRQRLTVQLPSKYAAGA